MLVKQFPMFLLLIIHACSAIHMHYWNLKHCKDTWHHNRPIRSSDSRNWLIRKKHLIFYGWRIVKITITYHRMETFRFLRKKGKMWSNNFVWSCAWGNKGGVHREWKSTSHYCVYELSNHASMRIIHRRKMKNSLVSKLLQNLQIDDNVKIPNQRNKFILLTLYIFHSKSRTKDFVASLIPPTTSIKPRGQGLEKLRIRIRE